MRNTGKTEEAAIASVPITARQLEALVRLTEANARLRLSSTATQEDAKKAVEILDFCLRNIGMDKETGRIDIDRIATSISSSERGTIMIIKEIISNLENKLGKPVPVGEIVKEAEAKGMGSGKTEEVIEQLKRGGDLFEPRRGMIQRL